MKFALAAVMTAVIVLTLWEGVRVSRLAWSEEGRTDKKLLAVALVAAAYGSLIYFGSAFAMRFLTEGCVDVL